MHPSYRLSALLLASLGLCTTACKQACDTDSLPEYKLSTGQQAWTASLTPGTVWRFRNAAGYERTYRVEKRDQGLEGVGGKTSLCPLYYRENVAVRLARTDSTNSSNSQFLMSASVAPSVYFNSTISWDSQYFELPIQAAEENGAAVLTTLTIGGRTYPHVLVSNSPDSNRPTAARRLYLSKEDGVVRFEERGGTVWDRQ